MAAGPWRAFLATLPHDRHTGTKHRETREGDRCPAPRPDRPSPEKRAEHVVTASDTDEADIDEEILDAIIADPVGSACRSEIASLGDFIFDMLGPTDGLEVVVGRIAALDEANQARRSAILDECWDGLGAAEDEE